MKEKLLISVFELSGWFSRVQRPLPWRQSADPYRIWISEVMLQQTQVATVIPYYERFLKDFPTVFDLAKAPEQQVLLRWAGLGYYSRARNLLKGARYIVDKHGGTFPQESEQLLEIPGIGPYTAGAISSIAFDKPAPIVDGNVQRVFARYYALGEQLGTKAAQDFFWKKARDWVAQAESPRILNQAIMELGATVCTKGKPACQVCPISKGCKAFSLEQTDRFPIPKIRKAVKKLWWASLIYQDRDKVWLVQNGESEWWAGLWDFPKIENWDSEPTEAGIRKAANSSPLKWLSRQEHTVTHHRIHVTPVVLGCRPEKAKTAGRWVSLKEAGLLPLSSLAKKVLNAYEHG